MFGMLSVFAELLVEAIRGALALGQGIRAAVRSTGAPKVFGEGVLRLEPCGLG